MGTVLDLITDTLEMLQVYAPGDIISDADAERMLVILNDMVDDWSNQSLATYEVLEQSGVLVPGQQSYTIGPGGNFNMTRPIRILTDPGTAYVQDGNGNNYSMAVVPRDKWNLYGNRSITIQSNFPDTLFYDPQFPLGVINVLPVPTLPYTMFWDSYLQLSDFSNLSQAVSLPPGYNRALKTNLAVAAAPYWKTAQLNPLIMKEALDRLGNLKRSNMRENVAIMEPELVSRSQISYNPYTDRQGNSSG